MERGIEGVRRSPASADLELGRSPRPDGARFFLSPEERAGLAEPSPNALPDHLLRLWTVKESLFKADPRNAGRGLLDYVVCAPRDVTGAGRARHDPSLDMRYASISLMQGYLTVAIAQRNLSLPDCVGIPSPQGACPERSEGERDGRGEPHP